MDMSLPSSFNLAWFSAARLPEQGLGTVQDEPHRLCYPPTSGTGDGIIPNSQIVNLFPQLANVLLPIVNLSLQIADTLLQLANLPLSLVNLPLPLVNLLLEIANMLLQHISFVKHLPFIHLAKILNANFIPRQILGQNRHS